MCPDNSRITRYEPIIFSHKVLFRKDKKCKTDLSSYFWRYDLTLESLWMSLK